MLKMACLACKPALENMCLFKTEGNPKKFAVDSTSPKENKNLFWKSIDFYDQSLLKMRTSLQMLHEEWGSLLKYRKDYATPTWSDNITQKPNLKYKMVKYF